MAHGQITHIEFPGQGWYAVLDDSEGNEVALYESLPES